MLLEPLSRTVNRLGRLAVESRELADADLLRRFADSRDDAAFAALVRRHGPMVFGVCCRSLGHVQDAEDAFQATFLILARRAQSVRAESVSRWLYGVAVKVANKARVRRDRRLSVPIEMDGLAATPQAAIDDWLPILDRAISNLPERHRWPILLCDLQGRSRAAAAAELGIAEGTLSSRLTRAREKLRARLLRLGIAPSLAALTVGLAPEPVPASLIESTLVAGMPAAAARELAEGVLRSMILAKLSKLAVVGLCAFSALGVGLMQAPTVGADPVPATKEAPKEAQPPAKDAPRAPTKSDAERFRGTWLIESDRQDGTSDGRSRDRWVGEEITFEHEKLTFPRFPGRKKSYKLDPGWDQKRIDFVFEEVADGNRRITMKIPSIYRFEGEKLHIVFGVAMGEVDERPESFEITKSGPPYTHMILRRPEPPAKKVAISEEQKALEGAWVTYAAEFDGVRREMRDTKLIFKGDRFSIRSLAIPSIEGETPTTEGEYSIDASVTPRRIDLTVLKGLSPEAKGKKVQGIYSLEDGRLTLCLDEGGKGRPRSFTKSGHPIMMFVREGTTMTSPPPTSTAVGSARLRELQQERIKALRTIAEAHAEKLMLGKGDVLEAVRSDEDLAIAESQLAATPAEGMKILESLVSRLKNHEVTAVYRAGSGTTRNADEAQVRAARLKWEIELERMKAPK